MKIVFLGTPELAVPSFERVVSDGHQVMAVFTQPDKPSGRGKHFHAPPIKIAAQSHNLPIYQPAKIRTDEVRALFESLVPDLAVIVAYGRIIPDWMLQIPKHGFINVHFSLLPAYRGAAPINWAIVRGERQTGVTTIQLVLELDAGDILLQQATEIGPDETAPRLGERLSQIGAELLSKTLVRLAAGSLDPQKQDPAAVSFAPILKRGDGLIDWTSMTAEQIALRVRGFQPWPGAYTHLRGTRLLIWEASPCDGPLGDLAHQSGTIVRADKSGIVIACKSSYLAVEQLQLEGRKRLPARDFINGIHLQAGEKFDT
jgi:methionyl-tRNA formyltransferase